MNIKILSVALLLSISIFGCSSFVSDSDPSVDFLVGMNQTNSTGAIVNSYAQRVQTVPQFDGVLINPTELWINIIQIGMKMDNTDWNYVKNSDDGRINIGFWNYLVYNKMVFAGNYSAFLIGYKADWYIRSIYTNKNGTIEIFAITNTMSQKTNYCIVGMPASITDATNQDLFLTNAECLATGTYSTIVRNQWKTYRLDIDTIGIIEVLTNSSGTKIGAVMRQPTLRITE